MSELEMKQQLIAALLIKPQTETAAFIGVQESEYSRKINESHRWTLEQMAAALHFNGVRLLMPHNKSVLISTDEYQALKTLAAKALSGEKLP